MYGNKLVQFIYVFSCQVVHVYPRVLLLLMETKMQTLFHH